MARSGGGHDHVLTSSRELQAGKDVVAGQLREIAKDFLIALPGRQPAQDILNGDTHSAHARAPAAFSRFQGDAIEA